MQFIRNNYKVDFNRIERLVNENGLRNASKILSEEVGDNMDNIYAAGALYTELIQQESMNELDLLNNYPNLWNTEYRTFVLDNYDTLNNYLKHDRSYGFLYNAITNLASNYLVKIGGTPRESVQWMWMRVAVQVAMPSIQEILDTYDMLSQQQIIHATPTCVNAGLRTPAIDAPQMESCFVVAVGDSMTSITDSKKILLLGSKCNGGFGLDVSRIRHSRVNERGITGGIPSLLLTLNEDVKYGNQLGSRSGAATITCASWHIDILTFLKMKDRQAKASIQASNLHYSVSCSDLFMRRAEKGEMWSLFCPRETQKVWVELHGGNPNNTLEVDAAPSLHDKWGSEFEEFYLQCEKSGIAREVIGADKLYRTICETRCRISTPFIFFVDNVNRKSSHIHIGTITHSNLCHEICQYTDPTQAATCDLATINAEEMVTDNGEWDYPLIQKCTRQLLRNTDRVIDHTAGIIADSNAVTLARKYISDPSSSKEIIDFATQILETQVDDVTSLGRNRHRAVGIGCMGLHSALSIMGYRYASIEGSRLATRLRACIYYSALDESCNRAQEYKPCPSWYGSPLSKGILQYDMRHEESKLFPSGKYRRYQFPEIPPHVFGINSTWDDLREKCKQGVRNSMVTCQMPNSTTSSVFGVSAGTEPFFDILYASSNNNGSNKVVYNALPIVLKQKGLYKPEELAQFLMNNKGSIQGYHKLWQNKDQARIIESIEPLFINAFAINKKEMLVMHIRFMDYICQSQSLSLYYDYPNVNYLMELEFLFWYNGGKTLYYLHRKPPGEKIAFHSNQLEIEEEVEEELQVCTMSKDCVWCQ